VSLASHVRSGSTQAFDDAVIRWMGAHRSPGLDAVMVEVTTLGTGIVVMMIVAVAALFLVLTQHKYSAILLLASTIGGIVLDGILKLGFNRPRPARWARWLVMTGALIVIALISVSRLYLGVHYPSDVVAGVAIGLAWAGFCMATLEAIQKFGIRRDPRILQHELPAPKQAASGSP